LQENTTGKHALMILDIDNFKGINDSLGHAFGDLVLIDIAAKLKTAFRDDDIVGRIGGDEFAVLMKNVSNISNVLKKGTELSEVFRQNYAGENGTYKISCSIGIIMLGKSGDTFETAYQKADAALYQAKKNGKDQFVLYQEGDAAGYPIEQIKPSEEERQNLRKTYSLETQIFELLYTSKDFDVSVNMALAAIGQEYHVNRVTVFENDTEGLTTGAIYEWCNHGIRSELANMQNWQLSSGGESIYDSFDQNDLLYCSDVRDLPPYLRQTLKARQVR
ncbi:MAG: GGDEF domain-containing protein, partial [Clostridia bacterium]